MVGFLEGEWTDEEEGERGGVCLRPFPRFLVTRILVLLVVFAGFRLKTPYVFRTLDSTVEREKKEGWTDDVPDGVLGEKRHNTD